jgi:hypothetical protein
LDSDILAKSAACSVQIVSVYVQIQSRADSYNVDGMIAMVIMLMMIVLVMVSIVPEALNQVDSVRQHWYITFQKLIDFHRLNASQGTLNLS